MSVTQILPAPVVQMGLVEKLVEVEQNQPHVQQLVAQELARQTLEEQSKRVHQSDESGKGRKVDEKNRDQRRREKEQEQRQAAQEQNEEEQERSAKPWAGHLLNIKI